MEENNFDQPTPIESNSNLNSDYSNTVSAEIRVINNFVTSVKKELEKVIVGQYDLVELLIIALLSDGHVLLEGVPGIAKTMTAKLLAKTMAVDFNRIQFTPDLMPSDVTGTNVFNVKNSEFSFIEGPIFSNIVLIDEINRAPAKTQASLFEVMEEKQVTVDGTTYKMDYPFFVIATQNPIEQEGTYRLPEAQLDRFMFKILLNYPSLDEEKEILMRFRDDFNQTKVNDVQKIITAEDLKYCRAVIEKITIKDELLDYIAQIVNSTRVHPDLFLGASPRASFSILKSSKAMAAIQSRGFVIPEDIQQVAYAVLNHRIILTPEKEMEGYTTSDVVKSIIEKIEVPR